MYHLSNASSSKPENVKHNPVGRHVYKIVYKRTCILKS